MIMTDRGGTMSHPAGTFARRRAGQSADMTDDLPREDRHPTDEPDGTTALAASLRPPGESVTPAAPQSGDVGDDFEDTDGSDTGDPFDGAVQPGQSRAGYDVDAVAGDTDAVRPD